VFKIIVFIIVLGICGTVLAYNLQAIENTDKNQEPEYLMGAGDKLEVYVLDHPEVSREVYVRPDGKISLPLIESINVDGITPSQLSRNITAELIKYIKEPKVSVIVMEYKSKNVLIIGEVAKPGLYQYEGNMTVFDAIGRAEGYNKHAELKSILVIRGAYSGEPEYYVANLYKAIHDSDISENVALLPKDIVYVPKNFIGNIGDFTDFYLSRIQPIATSYFFYKETSK
jgi:polysaccharide biosynthesis/export protein